MGLDATRSGRIVSWWLLSRAIVFGAAVLGNLALLKSGHQLTAFTDLWMQWDTNWYASIAQSGYGVPNIESFNGIHGDFQYNGAFFPGLPFLMWVGGLVGLSPAGTGLIVSLFASLIAAFALGRLTEDVGGRPEWGVAAWFLAPTAVFLAAPYTEALFAAFAFWAWVHGRRGQWIAAGVLAGCAAVVRSNALFLAIALLVLFFVSRSRDWRKAPALLLPFVVTLGYFAYLRTLTGSWTTWFDIQRVHWDRHLVDPWTAAVNTYNMIWTFTGTGAPSSRFVSELVAMAILVAFTVVVLVRRWWGEAAYLVVTGVSLGTSTWYYSIPRMLVVLFPIWMVLGLWLTRYRWSRWVYVIVAVPALVFVVVRYTQGQWIS